MSTEGVRIIISYRHADMIFAGITDRLSIHLTELTILNNQSKCSNVRKGNDVKFISTFSSNNMQYHNVAITDMKICNCFAQLLKCIQYTI